MNPRGAQLSEYRCWGNMIQRCTNPRNPDFRNWGGRGIGVSLEWRNSFATFFADMGWRPPGKWLERVDNNRGYCKENCRWATPSEQIQNKSWRRV
jgi:hypothetical protein